MNIKGVDGRDKPGHDDGESHRQKPLVLLTGKTGSRVCGALGSQ